MVFAISHTVSCTHVPYKHSWLRHSCCYGTFCAWYRVRYGKNHVITYNYIISTHWPMAIDMIYHKTYANISTHVPLERTWPIKRWSSAIGPRSLPHACTFGSPGKSKDDHVFKLPQVLAKPTLNFSPNFLSEPVANSFMNESTQSTVAALPSYYLQPTIPTSGEESDFNATLPDD